MMDPLYVSFDDAGKALNVTTTSPNMVLVQLSAAWCYKDPDSWRAMEDLLGALSRKKYTKISAYQYGIQMKMPGRIPMRSLEYLRSGIVTSASYGG